MIITPNLEYLMTDVAYRVCARNNMTSSKYIEIREWVETRSVSLEMILTVSLVLQTT